jgi:hypothetical protein
VVWLTLRLLIGGFLGKLEVIKRKRRDSKPRSLFQAPSMSSRAETDLLSYKGSLEKALSSDRESEVLDILKVVESFPINVDLLRYQSVISSKFPHS